MSDKKGFYDMHQKMSKTQPAECGGYEATYNGDGHDFNTKGKITKTSGSDYHDLARKDSGLHGNFAEKDAQLKYLTERGNKGIEIRHYSGTEENSKHHTGNIGPTAYNSRPIAQVYKPATSQGVASADQVVYSDKTKKITKG